MPSGRTAPADGRRARTINVLVVALACGVFVGISLYQLDLPGLYTDEAFDVIPSMQLVLGHAVELQRGAGVHLFGLDLPLMSSSDYQGITSTYLAVPFFALGGVNVFSLRAMTVLVGVLAIVLAFFLAREWFDDAAARLTVLLLAVSPSWVFWSRVGVYVVSEVVPIAAGALLAFTIWVRRRPLGRSNGPLYVGTFLLGLGLTTKLLFLWLIAALAITGAILYARRVWDSRREWTADLKGWAAVAVAAAGAFCAGAFPFLLYNAMTRGTLYVLRANAGSTTHGVDNTAVLRNLWTEADALRVLLDGSYFWFQGANGHPHFNPLSPSVFALACIGLIAWALATRRLAPGADTEARNRLPIVPMAALGASVALACALAVGQWQGAAAGVASLLSVLVALVSIVWLAVVGVRSDIGSASWALLLAGVVSGAAWWFLGAGRPEGRDPNGPLGLWPDDASGAIFWLAGAALLVMMGQDRRMSREGRAVVAALGIIGLVVAESTVTVSGLWSTHLLLILPLPQLIMAAWVVLMVRWVLSVTPHARRETAARLGLGSAALVVGLLVALDLLADYRYHRDLELTGGGSTFSDAIYGLAGYLETEGRPVVAMDWGFKRSIQLLTGERVNPPDAYGYSPEPTPEFLAGVRGYMSDPSTLYLFHTPEGTAYRRFDAFEAEAHKAGRTPQLVKTFYHRDGVPVYLVYEVR